MQIMSKTDIYNNVVNVSIADDFSLVPGPRFEWQGKDSGEEFLNKILRPKFFEAETAQQKLVVDLDATEGYSTAFLDGSFGELGRELGSDRIWATLIVLTLDEPYLETEIRKYMLQGSKK